MNKAHTIHSQLTAAAKFVGQQGNLQSVVDKYSSKYKSASELSDQEKKEILNQVPIYSSLLIGEQNAKTDNYEFRVFSDKARKKEYQASQEEMQIFKKFETDSKLEEIVIQNGDKLTVYRPVHIRKEHGC